MEKLKKNQNKWQQKKQLKNYNKINIDLKSKLGLNLIKEKINIVPIFIPHLGCNNECIFCNQRKISGHGSDVKLQDVEKEINNFLNIYKDSKKDIQIAFFGGSFTGLCIKEQEKFLKLANKYIDLGKAKNIRISTRPDYITNEILTLLKKYNVKVIELGVQSMSDTVLEKAKRGHTSQDVINASKMIRKFGFDLGHQIILGLPESTLDTEIFTIKECIKLKPKYLRIYPLYILKESKLFEMYEKNQYFPIELNDMVLRASKIYKIAIKNKLNVIRVGLQTTEEINQSNNEIKGPVTNNYRELVLSNIAKEEVIEKIKKYENSEKNIVIIVPKEQINFVVGYKRENISKFENIIKGKVIVKSK